MALLNRLKVHPEHPFRDHEILNHLIDFKNLPTKEFVKEPSLKITFFTMEMFHGC